MLMNYDKLNPFYSGDDTSSESSSSEGAYSPESLGCELTGLGEGISLTDSSLSQSYSAGQLGSNDFSSVMDRYGIPHGDIEPGTGKKGTNYSEFKDSNGNKYRFSYNGKDYAEIDISGKTYRIYEYSNGDSNKTIVRIPGGIWGEHEVVTTTTNKDGTSTQEHEKVMDDGLRYKWVYEKNSDGSVTETIYKQVGGDFVQISTRSLNDNESGNETGDEPSEGGEKNPSEEGNTPSSPESGDTSTGQTGSKGGKSKFSINDVLKSDLITDPNILYEHIIDESNFSSFDSFQSKIITDSNKIVTVIGEIKKTLADTNSKAFQSEENLKKLEQGLEDINNAKTIVGSVLSSEVKDIIKKYNEELRKKRKETRRYLADKTAKEISSRNLEDKSKREHGSTTQITKPSDSTYYKDGIYRVEKKWSTHPVATGIISWQSTTCYYYDFKYDEGASATHIESLLQKTGFAKELPYEISKIVDD